MVQAGQRSGGQATIVLGPGLACPRQRTQPGVGWQGGDGTRSYFLATTEAPGRRFYFLGRRSEHGGVGWGGVGPSSFPGARQKTSTTHKKGRGFLARRERRRASAEQRGTSKAPQTFNRHNRPIWKTRLFSAQRLRRRASDGHNPSPGQPEDDCLYQNSSMEFPPLAATTPERKRNRGASRPSAIGPSTISERPWPYPGYRAELFAKRWSIASNHSQSSSERAPRIRF